jgi:hypothetical protein
LKYVGTKFAQELSVLIIDLNLMRWRTFGDDEIASDAIDSDAIRIEQLTVAFAAFAELKLEMAFLVEHLDTMIVRVGDDDVVLPIDGNTGRFRELAFHNTELAEFAMIDHLLTLDLRPWRIHSIGTRCQLNHFHL